jgi:hypothetical protein
MNNQEARFILQAYRHGGQDAGDPVFAEALEQARRDPELARWLAEEMEFDAAVSRKLKEVPVPSQLKDRILAGRKVIAPKRWSRANLWLPLAACFVLFAGLLVWQFNRPAGDPVAGVRHELMSLMQSYPGHVDYEAAGLEAAREWFAQQEADSSFVLPASLSGIAKVGCRAIDWRGSKVSMLCLFLNGEHLDLVVIDRSALLDLPALVETQFAREGNWNTAMWGEGGKVYLLAGSARGEPQESLGRLL